MAKYRQQACHELAATIGPKAAQIRTLLQTRNWTTCAALFRAENASTIEDFAVTIAAIRKFFGEDIQPFVSALPIITASLEHRRSSTEDRDDRLLKTEKCEPKCMTY